MDAVVVRKGRTTKLPVKLMYDVSQDVITSQIRRGRNVNTQLIATWDVDFVSDGTDGFLMFTLDNEVTAEIEEDIGYMDVKRITAGEPVHVFGPIQVEFRSVITE